MAERQVNRYADIILTCSENQHCRSEIVLEDNSLVRLVSGELKVVQADRTYIFHAGDTFLFPRNQPSTMVKHAKDGKPYNALIMRLTTTYLRDYYTKNQVDLSHPHSHELVAFTSSPLLDSFFDSILPYFKLEQQLPEKLILVKTEEAIEILRSINENIDGILSDFTESGKIDLVDFMEKNYMFNIPLEKFSYLTGRSLTTFKRDFSKSFQTTPQKWLTKRRLELAHYQLSQQHRKPVDVYFETGFENLSHFSRAFKNHFGYNPTAITQNK